MHGHVGAYSVEHGGELVIRSPTVTSALTCYALLTGLFPAPHRLIFLSNLLVRAHPYGYGPFGFL